MDFGLRTVLTPVISRILIYGVNAFDVESVFNKLAKVPILNSKVLEDNWWEIWDTIAKKYCKIAEQAKDNGFNITARNLYFLASGCYYATYLINYKEISRKKKAYLTQVEMYQRMMEFYHPPIKRVEIPFGQDSSIPALLHIPEGNGPFPCVMFVTGIAASKEEPHLFARALVKRGIAVCLADIPGVGESLFCRDLKFRMEPIKMAFNRIFSYLESCENIDSANIGTAGICMAGALAFKAAALNKKIKFCVNLFPLILKIAKGKVPAWMIEGEWHKYLSGNLNVDLFLEEIDIMPDEYIECPYLMVHGKYDNWMPLEEALKLYKRALGEKKQIIIDDEPAFPTDNEILHSMPVGEQAHWVRHVLADWVYTQVNK